MEAAPTYTKKGRQCSSWELQEEGKQGAPPNYGNPLELTISGPNSGGSFPRAVTSLSLFLYCCCSVWLLFAFWKKGYVCKMGFGGRYVNARPDLAQACWDGSRTQAALHLGSG